MPLLDGQYHLQMMYLPDVYELVTDEDLGDKGGNSTMTIQAFRDYIHQVKYEAEIAAYMIGETNGFERGVIQGENEARLKLPAELASDRSQIWNLVTSEFGPAVNSVPMNDVDTTVKQYIDFINKMGGNLNADVASDRERIFNLVTGRTLSESDSYNEDNTVNEFIQYINHVSNFSERNGFTDGETAARQVQIDYINNDFRLDEYYLQQLSTEGLLDLTYQVAMQIMANQATKIMKDSGFNATMKPPEVKPKNQADKELIESLLGQIDYSNLEN